MHKFNRGFSLLEVLVAFVILAMILGVLMQIFSGGLRNASRVNENQQAILLGQSKLASVGIETPMKISESDGEFDAVYRWHVSIRPYLETPAQTSEQTGMPVPILPVSLLEVEVQVLWGGGNQSRSASLKTLRLVNAVAL
ncbi:General secretion pathway protein I [Candidatus Nitrotoga sp. BS]|uniref:prepilin-type N-terminal cleavage/methylation domain-containing protein n=1 Tax=Candidatus Nitrotoga sp. BS TaxID=2890408 RepID=UPI001EF1C96F|nr:prepilin-type N-terminal cleavage/methylation domain-containing protein [Candidatus Nitrotoga sp. BS]CAH1191095.1 General secretion pathway protein I [Candidatus Nitrotoga sp. BS]